MPTARKRIEAVLARRKVNYTSEVGQTCPCSLEWKGFLSQNSLSHGEKVRIIDREDMNRRATNGSSAGESCAGPLKVVIPAIQARMKEANKLTCVWICPGNIRTFMSIAV